MNRALPPPGEAERVARLRLSRTESVGPVTFHHLLQRHGSAKAALEALPDLARRSGRTAPLRIPSPAEIAQELEAGAKAGAALVVFGEPAYPALLAALDPPPPVLWTVGSILLTRKPCVAIVGARVASASGQRFARQLAVEFGEAGVVVVSGLARGIDGAAHEGSLPTGTIAVLGGGVDDVYPSEHRALHQRIGREGCLVSENAMGRRAKAQDFPRRNRIIAGLSLATVVVEAELRSGSLITARLANEQGREVFAVPGSPLDPRAKGPNDLIRKGAQMCESAADVLDVLREGRRLEEPQRDLFDPPPPPPPDLDEREARVLRERVSALLSPTPTPRDELIRAVGAPPPAVFAALVELEIAGRAELLPGGLVAGI